MRGKRKRQEPEGFYEQIWWRQGRQSTQEVHGDENFRGGMVSNDDQIMVMGC